MPKWLGMVMFVLLLGACSESSPIVADSKDFTISRQAFEAYKANVQQVYASNKQKFDVPDSELLNQMIERETLLSIARARGIAPTEQEVARYAQATKEAFDKDATAQMRKLHAQLADKLGVSKDAYFTHPSVMKQYEELLTLEQLIATLTAEGTVTDEQTLARYVQQQRPTVTIDDSIRE